MIRVRANVNLHGAAFGSELLVDDTDPEIQGMIAGGYLTPLAPQDETIIPADGLVGSAGVAASGDTTPGDPESPANEPVEDDADDSKPSPARARSKAQKAS